MKSKLKLSKRDLETLLLAVVFCALVILYLSNPTWGAETFPVSAPTRTRTGEDILTLEDCLRIAEENHPDLKGAEARSRIERRRLSQTAVADRMTVSGKASATRLSTGNGENAGYSAGMSASVQIFDSKRTKYSIDAQRHTLTATEAEAEQTLLSVRTNVKSAYMDLLLAIAVRGQRQESVDAFRKHLEQARGFYEAGWKPRSDVTKAEVDLGTAELNLVEAESNVDIARDALLNAMGVMEGAFFDIQESYRHIPPELEQGADERALENRSDYRSAEYQIRAGEATLRSEARYGSPSVSLEGGYSVDGDDLFSLDTGWNVGLSMSIPVVDGGATKARTGIAQGQIDSLEASRETLRQNILLAVRKALLNIKNARERIRISELTIVQAEENFDLAEGRYDTGVGDALEITDALLALTDARLSVYQSRYDLQIALIALETATGVEVEYADL